MSEGHALLAPSSADRWMLCPGSVLLTKDIPEIESEYAKEGTAAHEYSALWLSARMPPVLPWKAHNGIQFSNDISESGAVMDAIADYVIRVNEFSKGHTLLVEQKLPIGHVTLEEDAEGTGDAIIIHEDGNTIEVNDLKFGMGVKVYAKKNRQMMLYALGAIFQFSVFGDFQKIILRIHQPRLNHLDEWECTRSELEEFGEEVQFRAQFIWRLLKGEVEFNPEDDLVPGEKQCMWCTAKATCPALAKHTMLLASDDFTDLEKKPKFENALTKLETIDSKKLSWYMQNLDLIEDWIKAVRGKVELELLQGREVPGFKLVEGRKGGRKWENEAAVEKIMIDQAVPGDLIYKPKEVISVAQAEKFLKKDKKTWVKLHDLIVQTDGKPSVAPSTDPRPALVQGKPEDDFKVLE